MVDAYQTGEPIPDGYLTIQLVNPLNPWIDYLDPRDMPTNLEGDFWFRVNFREIKTWREDGNGVHILYDDHRDFFPWGNIHNYTVSYNSKEYNVALDEYRLGHDHDWTPQTEGNANFKWCEGCKVSDAMLEKIEQRRIDTLRGLKK